MQQWYSKNTQIELYINLIKFLIFAAIIYVIYDFIWVNNSNPAFIDNLLFTLKNANPIYLVLCIVLAPFNWLLESIKWKRLIQSFNPLSVSQCLKSILFGISLGVITPGRVGEYGGRLLNIAPTNISRALFAHFVGSIAQNLINILPGTIACYYFLMTYYDGHIKAVLISSLFLLMAVLMTLLYFNSQRLIRISHTHKWLRKYTNKLGTYQLSNNDLRYILSLSTIRYFIYVSQYVLLLYYFKIDIGLLAAISSVVLIFLFQSSIPLPPMIGLAARTQLAIFVLSKYEENYTSILSVPVLLWAINLLLPSLSGAVILLKSNFNKYFQHV